MKLPKFNKEWKWMAMDKDGNWHLYASKPKINIKEGTFDLVTGWEEDESIVSNWHDDTFEPAKDWRKSLIRINK